MCIQYKTSRSFYFRVTNHSWLQSGLYDYGFFRKPTPLVLNICKVVYVKYTVIKTVQQYKIQSVAMPILPPKRVVFHINFTIFSRLKLRYFNSIEMRIASFFTSPSSALSSSMLYFRKVLQNFFQHSVTRILKTTTDFVSWMIQNRKILISLSQH